MSTLTTNETVEISVHVVNAATYRGEWLDLWDYSDEEEFLAAVRRVTGNADELVITNIEGLSDTPGLTSLADVWSWHELINEDTQPYHRQAMAAYLAHQSYVIDYTSNFEDAYAGEWDSIEDLALDFFESVYGEIDFPGFRIEVDEIAWRCDYSDTVAPDGTRHFFRNV